MTGKDKRTEMVLLTLAGLPAVVWLGLVFAPYLEDGLVYFLAEIAKGNIEPLRVGLCNNSLKSVVLFLFMYFFGMAMYFSTRKNYRRGEEHGSAHWGSPAEINRKYLQKPQNANLLLTQNVHLGLNGKIHLRNLNVLVIGGSGAGKTRFYCKPNIMQANTSFVILDPKGEILRDLGYLLEAEGYDIRVLDLINMEKSNCYNPFVYLQTDNDVQRLVTNLFKSTTPKGSQSSDPFWGAIRSHLKRVSIA